MYQNNCDFIGVLWLNRPCLQINKMMNFLSYKGCVFTNVA